MKKVEKEINVNKDFTTQKINLEEFNKKDVKKQYKEIEEILTSAYDKDTKILKSWVLSSIEVTCNDKDDIIYLPCNLCVEKKKDIVTFSFKKRSKLNFFLLIVYILAFLLGILAATYWAVFYLSRADLNKDIDNDGIADINLDINNDGHAEINIDTDNDDKPNLNIDYKGNRKAVFNIDKNGDGKPDFNLVNDATNGKKCDVNCDLDGDGWPDINLDIDGDGKPDFDIDINGDNIPDINLDTNGDQSCNIMCDTDGDLVCDKYCIDNNDKEVKRSGSTTVTGSPENDISTGGLVITYDDNSGANSGILPDDMYGSAPISSRTFKVENTSNYPIAYKLVWRINRNDFLTENLKYKLESTDKSVSTDFLTVPHTDTDIVRNIIIPPRNTHYYTLSFRFVGIGRAQNEDQGRTINGIVAADYDEAE